MGQLELDLVTLERETLGRVIRTLHTVKGTAGFLGLARLHSVGHAGENLLSRVRAGELAFDAEIATALLGVVDAVHKSSLRSSEARDPAVVDTSVRVDIWLLDKLMTLVGELVLARN